MWNRFLGRPSRRRDTSPVQVERLETRFLPAGTVTGIVFRDYNNNGAQDAREPGVGGVTVTAFDSGNTAIATTTTSAAAATLGQYTLPIPGATTRVRIEFTGLPTFLFSGAFGPQSGTSVQFVDTSGGSATANFSVSNPAEFTQPLSLLDLIAACYATGNQLLNADGSPNTSDVLFSFDYQARGNTAAHATIATANQVGSVYGLAYQRSSNVVFAAPLMRRHSGLGPGGTGTIYRIDLSTTPATVTALTNLDILGAAFDTGSDTHPTASGTYNPNLPLGGGSPWWRDAGTFGNVGKMALGDLDISEDGRTLYTINLFTRELIAFPIMPTGVFDPGRPIQRFPMPLTQANDPLNFNNPQDIRPFGLGVKDGVVYAGLTYTAETTQNRNELRSYVYSFNPVTGQFSPAPVLTADLTYERGSGDINGNGPSATDPRAAWNPWTPANVFPRVGTDFTADFLQVYPQPMLTDIAFDNGAMILGFGDRMGYQGGYFSGNPLDANDATNYTVISAGDTLRAGNNGNGTWTLENAGVAGGVSSGDPGGNGGPGGREFYYNDEVQRRINPGDPFSERFGHQEITLGSVLQVPGAPQLAVSGYDGYAGFTGTILWFENVASPGRSVGQNVDGDVTFNLSPVGVLQRGVTPPYILNAPGERLQLFDTPDPDPADPRNVDPTPIISKASGLGDMDALALAAPIEIGNRIFLDVNANGIQDAVEPGLAGVTVRLLDAGGAPITTTVTDAQGNYIFRVMPNTPYRLAVALNQAPLANTLLTTANASANDAIDSDATANGGDAVIMLTTGDAGQNNHTFDIGFFQNNLSLGNRVFFDVNNNGRLDLGEVGIAGVTVNLYRDSNNDGTPDGALIGTQTTNATGHYLFTGLSADTYIVEVVTPAGFSSSTGTPLSPTGPFEPAPDPDNDVDSDDNGTTQGAVVRSGPVTLAFGTEPTGEALTTGLADPAPDVDSNLTVDFGFCRRVSLGNRVFNDANNNGRLDATEAGITGVTVNLYRDSNNDGTPDGAVLLTTTTNATGHYLFTLLDADTYIVEAVTPVGFRSSTGAVGSPTGPFEPAPDPDNDVDSDDNGTTAGNVVRSAPVTLAFDTEPLNEAPSTGLIDSSPDADSNLTVDFGFFRPLSLGNRVFNDPNNNGLLDVAEVGIAGVTVNLYRDSDNNGTPDGAAIQTTSTNATGHYLFTGLSNDTYLVEVVTPSGFTSSTGTPLSATGPFEPAPDPDNDIDSDDNGTTAGNVVRSAPVTLAAGTEPLNEAPTTGLTDPAADADSNLTVDFGFFGALSLGNRVFNDANNNGRLDATEAGIASVTVNLYRDSNNDGTPDGAILTTTTTNATGHYLFTGLIADTYLVEVVTPSGFTSSTGTPLSATGPFEPAPDPDNDVDSDDNGTTQGGVVRSAPVTLAAGTEPTGEAPTTGIIDPAADADSNLTVDFGFFRPLSLGNRVFNDDNNNGRLDATETGIANVAVRLYRDSNNDGTPDGAALATTTTNATGHYLFTGLVADTYIVEVVTPAGCVSSTGALSPTTGPFEPALDPDNDVDSDDNGTAGVGVVRSGPVTLSPGAEPTGEAPSTGLTDAAADVDSNLTVDFGFFKPLSLGNRVFLDVNNNGLLDVAETGIANVAVNLYRDSNNDGTPDGGTIATTTTNATGHYLFTGLSADTYIVEVVTPVGFTSSTGTPSAPTGPFEPAPDPDNDVDSDDNGTASNNVVRSGPVTLTVGGEPLGEAATTGIVDPTPDNNSNLSVDFGFFSALSLGNRVFLDANNNGLLDATESGLAGVTVNLYRDSDNNGLPDGALIATRTTTATGHYLFTGLVADTYIVEVVTPSGLLSSTGTPSAPTGPFEPAPDPDNDVDSDDNGTTSGTVVRSGPVTLAAGTEPVNEAPTTGIADPTADADSNLTVDFGFFSALSLGNRVFNDDNNNGLLDATETGIANVAVRLYRDSNNDGTPDGAAILTTTTNATGHYLFTGLNADTYIVEVVTPAGCLSSSGAVAATGPFEPAPDPDNNVDSDDNGTTAGNVVRSGPVTLAVGTEPTGEAPTTGITDAAADADSNLTVDFGFFKPLSLGNRVFGDVNNNGRLDAGESGIANVPVRLYRDSNKDGTPDGAAILTTTTNATGHYLFTLLNPDGYIVEIVPPSGFQSSTGTGAVPGATGPFEPGPSPANGVDSDDNGTTSAAAIRAGTVMLMRGAAPTGEAPTEGLPDSAADADSDLTVDFGLIRTLTLGNLVWNDLNNDGLRGANEPGLGNVTVRLFDAAGTTVLATTTTDANGNYLFRNLQPGNYVVKVTTPAGFRSSTGSGVNQTSGPFEPAPAASPNNDLDNDDDGTTGTDANAGTICSHPVTLAFDSEPTNDGDDANGNLSVDFGLVRPNEQPPKRIRIVSKISLLSSSSPERVNEAEVYVNRLYREVLGREADQSGLETWVYRLLAGGTRAEVARAFWTSPECRALQVQVYYRQFLKRDADPEGLRIFTNQLLNGVSELDVATTIATSAEYVAAHPDATSFLTGLYNDVLGRAPDASATAFFLPLLADRGNWPGVARSILASNEANSRVVGQLYVDTLRRPGDAAGVAFAAAALTSGRASVCDIAVALLASDEYRQRP